VTKLEQPSTEAHRKTLQFGRAGSARRYQVAVRHRQSLRIPVTPQMNCARLQGNSVTRSYGAAHG